MPPPDHAVLQTAAVVTEESAKDAIIAWFLGEFAAANAIIDSLCSHVAQLGEAGEYEAVFMAVHRRRMNWIPILQRQKYYSIAEVEMEIRRVAEREVKVDDHGEGEMEKKVPEDPGEDRSDMADQDSVTNVSDDSPESDITDTGSHPMCCNHEESESRLGRISMTKGFTAKGHVKGFMVNVVRGLKLYDDVFNDCELSKLSDYVNELRVVGHKGEFSGETFLLYNQHMKGKKREVIQFGAPIFAHMKEKETGHENSYIEPIPTLLQGVIDHLIQWHLISETRKPNSCIINFFDEGEFSQPFMKPPHLEQPITTIVLSESIMAFGGTLVCDNEGNYKGPLMLSLRRGSVLVMRGNSADMARHAMCSSPNKRVSIVFFRVHQDMNRNNSSLPPLMNRNGNLNCELVMNLCPKWGVVQAPVIMLASAQPMILSPKQTTQEGTGVFLPSSVELRKPVRRLPPRAQKRQFLSPSSACEMEAEKAY